MDEKEIKRDLCRHLRGGEAFARVDQVLVKIPYAELGVRPAGLPYSFFELFSHIRFTQKDILEYCTTNSYEAPKWPDAYWPANPAPDSPQEWQDLQERYFIERKAFIDVIFQAESLTAKVPSSENHSLLREALLVIEHTAYHTGQLLILLRHLGRY